MGIQDIYQQGEAAIRNHDYGRLLDYVESGFVRDNDRRLLDRFSFRQRCVDAPEADPGCTVLGVELSAPIIMSAMTMPIPAISEDGLMQVARGLKAAGSLMWTGTPLPQNLKALADTGVPVVANVKPLRDRQKMHQEIETIVQSGATWLGLEVDTGQGTKVGDKEMGFDCKPYSRQEIEDIKKRLPIPLVCKGILSQEDARKCVDAGADLLVVSNHGGHTLDYLPHPFQVIDEIVEAVGRRVELMVDGGFRRGSDILKGLAFGASLVGLGRPILYALAAGGQEGLAALFQELRQELIRLMTMTGASSPDKVSRDMLIEAD
jgi:isopentenyl diphosphate isomerase/L-lactate dehydrogenase-like FMN-dependent dehydrogenase